MKRSFIPLLLASVIILTSMSECDKENWERVNVKLNGVQYGYSSMNFHHTGGKDFPVLQLTDDGFSFEISRTLSSADGQTVQFQLSMDCDEPFELYHPYPFEQQGNSQASLLVWVPDGENEFIGYHFSNTSDGYVEFTEYAGDHSNLFGRFEFTAVNSELDSTIYVSDGIFENLDVIRPNS